MEDRNISVNETGINPVIPGESTTTGLPLSSDAEYQPMLVQISNATDTVSYNGSKTTGGGIGDRAPWGGQYADIVYEGLLYSGGQTRITFLVSDAFADGVPDSMGPVRSARIGHVLLREEWDAGLIFAGGPETEDNDIFQMLRDRNVYTDGLAFDLVKSNDWVDYYQRVSGVVSPENVDVDVIALRNTIPDTTVAVERPFLFTDESPYTDGYDTAYEINLDFGHKQYISHFYYDEMENIYLRYSGDAPYMTYASASDRSEESQEQLSFSNVIIQRVEYEFVNGSSIMPDMQSIGSGNADIFIGGRYIAGYWVRNSEEDPTVFYDDQGNEIQLTRGTTYIAHLQPEGLLTYK